MRELQTTRLVFSVLLALLIAGFGQAAMAQTPLANGVPVSDAVESGQWDHYALAVTGGALLLDINTTGTDDDIDLYVRFGAQPTTGTYDYRPFGGGGDEEVAVTPGSSPRPLTAGTWYISVRGVGTSAYTLTATFYTAPNLISGVPVTHSVTEGDWRMYCISVPSGATSMTLTTSGATADVDLYLRFGDAPTWDLWDYRPYGSTGNETITVTPTSSPRPLQAGYWYAGINGFRNASYTLTATVTGGATCVLSCTATVPATGQVGTPVSFAATATPSNCAGSPAFAWTFGDGATSSQQNPSHAYASAGTYAWSLTVSVGGTTCTKYGNVAISAAPTCSLACTATVPATGQVGSPVSLASTATPSNCVGSPTFAWTFGDGQTSAQQSPSHTYASSGTYSWGLTVSVSGVTCTRVGSLTISEGGTCSVPGDCDGSGTVSIGEVQKAINMFLGSIAPSCCVDANADGAVSIGEVQKVINAFLGVAPTIAVTVSPASASLVPGGTQPFSATVTGTTNTAVTWSVQEGAAGGSITQGGLYAAPKTEGTFHVVATSQADPTKSGTATVVVSGGGTECAFDCSVSAPTFALMGTPATFASVVRSANCPGTLTHRWDFGDGTDSVQQNPSHTYGASGQYAWSYTASMGGLTCSRSGVIVVVASNCAGIAVTPTTVSVDTFGKVAFAANLTAEDVVWKVEEGQAGGWIAADGVYDAPYLAGTYHILASSRSDPTRCGRATVTVTPGDQAAETKTGDVSSAGGSVSLSDGTALVIPTGAVSATTTVTLSRLAGDPLFGEGVHAGFAYSFSGPVSAASLKVPLAAGVDPESYGAAFILPDVPGIVNLPGTVGGGFFTADLGGAGWVSPGRLARAEGIPSGKVAVESVASVASGRSGVLLQVPYYEQYSDGACWAAAMLMFAKAHDPRCIPGTVHGILALMGIGKDDGYSQSPQFYPGYGRRVAIVSGEEIVANWWSSIDNFVSYVVARLDEGKPVLAYLIYHQGLFVGYERDGQDKLTLIYHDPNNANFNLEAVVYPRFPYQRITPEKLSEQFWERSVFDNLTYFVSYVAKDAYQDAPNLQTVMLPDTEKLAIDGVTFLKGNWSAQCWWDHTNLKGYTLAVPNAGAPPTKKVRVRPDFQSMRVRAVPVWNLDTDQDASIRIKTQLFRREGIAFLYPPILEDVQEPILPSYDPADSQRARYQHQVYFESSDLEGKLLPTDGRFAIQVELRSGGDDLLERIDVQFELEGPFITSIAPSPAPVNGEVLLEGFGFGTHRAEDNRVRFTGDGGSTVDATSVLSWGENAIRVKVPVGAESGPVQVVATGKEGNKIPAEIEGVWDPNQTMEVSFYVFRRNGGSKQASQNYTIQILRDGQVVDSGSAIATNGLWETTLRVGTTYGFVVDASWTFPDESRHLTGNFHVLPDRTNWIEIEKPANTASVSLSPVSATLPLLGTKSFYAVATSVGGQTALAWTVEEAGGGSVTGTDDGIGLYKAPQTPGTYHVRATAAADATAYARATVTVTNVVSVELTPEEIALPPGGSTSFTASVTGATELGVTWTATGGSFGADAGGTVTYTAPTSSGTYTVTATSKADPTKKDTAAVQVPSGSSVTLTYGGAVNIPALSNTIKIPATVQASGSVAAPVVPGGSGQLMVPEWYGGEAGPTGGMVMTGCRGVPGTVALSGTTLFTPQSNSYQDGDTLYTIKGVRYETCWSTDQNPNGSWKMECNQAPSFSATVSCAGGTGAFTRILVDIEETTVSQSGGVETRAVTYPLSFSGAFVSVDVW